MTAVIPERTIDYWLGAEILEAISDAMLWGPVPNAQRIFADRDLLLRDGRPYDLIGGVPARHVFALEAKSLLDHVPDVPGKSRWGVQLNEDQHWAMLILERYHPELAWYALPAPDLATVGLLAAKSSALHQIPALAGLRRGAADFGLWMRVIRPSDLDALLPGFPHYPPADTAPTEVKRAPGADRPDPDRAYVDLADYEGLGDQLRPWLHWVDDCKKTPSGRTVVRKLLHSEVQSEAVNVGRLAWVGVPGTRRRRNLAGPVGEP